MSAAPLDPPGVLARLGPWSLDDLLEIDDEVHRFEVVEGSLVVSPPPMAFHQRVGRRLFIQLHEQLPAVEWEAVYEEYVRLARRDGGTDGRQPDVALFRAGLPAPRRRAGYPPDAFGLVVEVVSPTSTRRDRVHKKAEYAEAGIPHYWLVETEPDVLLVAHDLAAGTYREVARVASGTADLRGPVPLRVDVDALR